MAKHTEASLFYRRVFRISLATLPYLYYLSLLGLLAVLVHLFQTFRKSALTPLVRNSLLLIAGLMVVSAIFAFNKGEAFLQLANFFPFFLLFSVLPFLFRGVTHLEQIAADLVITAIPINLIAGLEYLLKGPFLPDSMRRIPLVDWVRSAPHKGRAMVMFDHPNALASYLVLILGLGLGLLLKASVQDKNQFNAHVVRDKWINPPLWFLYFATYLNLVGIFSSGSRNGVVIAISQLVIFSLLIKTNRAIRLTGIIGLLLILVISAAFGIGGRVVSIANLKADPRIGVWTIALDLMRERPWLGWGLGNYKFLYPSRLIDPNYPDIFHPHNFWLLLGSEAGIFVMGIFTVLVGFICFKAINALRVKKFLPGDRAIIIGYFLSFWGCVGFALFDVTFYDARINIINWLVLAGIYAVTQMSPRPLPPGCSSYEKNNDQNSDQNLAL